MFRGFLLPFSSEASVSLIAVCPPNCTTAPSGFSIFTMFSPHLPVCQWLEYCRSLSWAISKSVLTVSVVVADNGLIAFFFECPGTKWYGAEVELIPLSNTEWSNSCHDFLLIMSSMLLFSYPVRQVQSNMVLQQQTQLHRYLPSCKRL